MRFEVRRRHGGLTGSGVNGGPAFQHSEALEWLDESVCIERIRQSLSACSANLGSNLLISSPLSPCLANLNGEPLKVTNSRNVDKPEVKKQ